MGEKDIGRQNPPNGWSRQPRLISWDNCSTLDGTGLEVASHVHLSALHSIPPTRVIVRQLGMTSGDMGDNAPDVVSEDGSKW